MSANGLVGWIRAKQGQGLVISAALELAILGNSLTPGTLAGCVFTLLGVVLVMRS
ncbi:hypothetical protein HaLaN_15848, partial [Haematococcus lacustris]